MLASALPRRESNCQHSNIQAYLAGGHRQKFQSVVPKDTSLVDCVHRKPCSSVYAKMSHSLRESTGVSSMHGKYDRNVIPSEVSHRSFIQAHHSIITPSHMHVWVAASIRPTLLDTMQQLQDTTL